MTAAIRIGSRLIGLDHPPFVIAEMSGNHNGSLDRALAIVDAAAGAGAHAFKVQTYTPDTMTLDLNEREFHIADAASPWAGRSLYDLYGEAQMPWSWHEPIFARARKLGMIAFSTPFDASAVDVLEALDVPCYKIASFENTDLPLIRRVAATGKLVFLSTGMATLEELEGSVAAARDAGCRDLVLLKCTSTYPAAPDDINLQTLPDMRSRFTCEVGLSDHTVGVGVALAAVAMGATVIEKHVTLDRREGGVDSSFSMEPDELTQLVTETGRSWRARGTVQYGATTNEKPSLQFRRSLYVVKDIKAGERLTSDNVRAIRPGLGLPPRFLDQVIRRRAAVDIARGTPLDWKMVEEERRDAR
jgi:pseudaminic acid synthase